MSSTFKSTATLFALSLLSSSALAGALDHAKLDEDISTIQYDDTVAKPSLTSVDHDDLDSDTVATKSPESKGRMFADNKEKEESETKRKKKTSDDDDTKLHQQEHERDELTLPTFDISSKDALPNFDLSKAFSLDAEPETKKEGVKTEEDIVDDQGHHLKKTITKGDGWQMMEISGEEHEGIPMDDLGPLLAGMMHKSMLSNSHGKKAMPQAHSHPHLHLEPHFMHGGPGPAFMHHFPHGNPHVMHGRFGHGHGPFGHGHGPFGHGHGPFSHGHGPFGHGPHSHAGHAFGPNNHNKHLNFRDNWDSESEDEEENTHHVQSSHPHNHHHHHHKHHVASGHHHKHATPHHHHHHHNHHRRHKHIDEDGEHEAELAHAAASTGYTFSTLTVHLLVVFFAMVGFFVYQMYTKHMQDQFRVGNQKNMHAKGHSEQHHEINLASLNNKNK